ncbi:hypothetical protein [Methylorubrum extorquens]|uniref:hypothetical protein n=1 Tax=Methylorubrum extorquens TaxID=408 RepID=UPI0001590662|nr:hypothetical protein [Methylorubrum extorquens]ABY29156.1 hypothetical protein Mext_0744 [Methylorubrum extorquens PA1]WIU40504.1 hypothetical protein KQ926_03910 [Methylorubrum extorquens]
MAETDDYLRMLLNQAAAEEAFLDRVTRAEDAKPNETATLPATSPAVPLMITNRQRAGLRDLGFSDEAIRQMTPAEAHEHLGLTKLVPDRKIDGPRS